MRFEALETLESINNTKFDTNQAVLKSCEEIGGNKRMMINFRKDDFYHFETIYLSQENSPFLKMNFIFEEDRIRAYYDVTSYIPLKQYVEMVIQRENDARWEENVRFKKEGRVLCELIKILLDTLEVLKKAEDLLLFTERVSIAQDIIFLKPKNKKVRLAYLPEKELSSVDKMVRLIENFEEITSSFCPETGRMVFDRLKKWTKLNNPGVNGVINEVIQLHRDSMVSFQLGAEYRSKEALIDIAMGIL